MIWGVISIGRSRRHILRIYQAKIDEDSRKCLAHLANGIVGIGLGPHLSSPSYCYFALTEGSWINISCLDHQLEWKFEAISLLAEHVSTCPYPVTPLTGWSGKNRVFLLRAVDWVTDDNVEPQYSNKPGMLPTNALACCSVDVGLVIENEDHAPFVVASAAMSMSLCVSGFTNDEYYFALDDCEWVLL